MAIVVLYYSTPYSFLQTHLQALGFLNHLPNAPKLALTSYEILHAAVQVGHVVRLLYFENSAAAPPPQNCRSSCWSCCYVAARGPGSMHCAGAIV